MPAPYAEFSGIGPTQTEAKNMAVLKAESNDYTSIPHHRGMFSIEEGDHVWEYRATFRYAPIERSKRCQPPTRT